MTPRPGNCHAGLNGGLAVLEHYGDPRALLAAGLELIDQAMIDDWIVLIMRKPE